MFELTLLQKIAVSILPILFAITVHEVAHGWVAKHFGDSTAQRLGRLTLNPLKHIDPMGTVLIPGLMLLMTQGRFAFGWARPVPVTWENLRHPKRDMAIVAAAGPAANLLMALFWAFIAKAGIMLSVFPWTSVPMQLMGIEGIKINVLFMMLNLFPIPPLDGGRVAVGLLPGPWAWRLARLEPYGFFIILFLLVTDVLWWILGPAIDIVTRLIVHIAGLG